LVTKDLFALALAAGASDRAAVRSFIAHFEPTRTTKSYFGEVYATRHGLWALEGEAYRLTAMGRERVAHLLRTSPALKEQIAAAPLGTGNGGAEAQVLEAEAEVVEAEAEVVEVEYAPTEPEPYDVLVQARARLDAAKLATERARWDRFRAIRDDLDRLLRGDFPAPEELERAIRNAAELAQADVGPSPFEVELAAAVQRVEQARAGARDAESALEAFLNGCER
jgi:hypothetical protein